MNRVALLCLLLLGFIPKASADHITGGEISYTFTRMQNGLYDYAITVRMFMRCNSGREFNDPTVISIFDRESGARVNNYTVPIERTEKLVLTETDPCVTNPPPVCYEVAYYQFYVSLPASPSGYTITSHVMFRIDGIKNMISNYDRVGATYVGEIPGTNDGGPQNNSAHFVGSDLVVVCAENSFSYSFAATDNDGDDLRYSFCNALRTSGSGGFGEGVEPPPPPPYQSIPYGNKFNGNSPLGGNVIIDSKTGMITGIAPGPGAYVVTVCVEEIRNGKVIATQHKDLQINIAPCSIAAASLPAEFMLCGDTKTLSAKNLSTSNLVKSYNWEFIDRDGSVVFNSTDPQVTHTFSDTGTYLIRLFINQDKPCSDSTTSTVRVYPGFVPDFFISSPCIIQPARFNDATTSILGTVNAWEWDFGEVNSSNDFSDLQNPTFTYPSTGDKRVQLIAQNTLGCRDTIIKTVDIFDKPPIQLAFRDTLICPPDNLELRAAGRGIFNWAPLLTITGSNTAAPVVSPVATTTYHVTLNDDGCINNDSVKVNVVDQVSLQLMNDATICTGDSLILDLVSDAQRYSWSPALSLNDPIVQDPVAFPSVTITYQVTASISACTATDQVTITPVPYPTVNAGPDTTICFDTPAQLHATTDGSSYSWTPASSLQRSNTLDPVAVPGLTTSYLIYAYDTRGCPKPGMDTVVVTVQPEIIAYAGRDTTVVIGQPLQLRASGGSLYSWSPAFGLSANDISDPIAKFSSSPSEGFYTYKVLVSDNTGCMDSASVRVIVFNSAPEIYVPTAFTPNTDGRNDYFQLVAAGIQHIQIFRVYNRWGQLLFDTPGTHSQGWDGNFGGKPQPSGTYVWMVRAIDYTGRPISRKGTVTLIR